ncbi:MAG: SMP-30/gluconolactonase/LRE family protein [Kineosporiaceae bacterium]
MSVPQATAQPPAPARRRRSRLIAVSVASVIVVGAAVALLWPSPIDAEAWSPAPAPAAEGVLAENDALRDGVLVGDGEIRNPEDVTFDAEGRLYAGSRDLTGFGEASNARIVRVSDPGGPSPAVETFVDLPGGNPLDVRFDRDGNLLVADWNLGLLSVSPDGQVDTVLALGREIEGIPFDRPDGIAVTSDGTVFVTEGSHRPGPYNGVHEALEGRFWGRLIELDPATRDARVVTSDLSFGNGMAVTPDGRALLVADTYRYRIQRYWLGGDREGTVDTFADNLPGLPHNIAHAEDGTLWVGVYGGRMPLIDRIQSQPFLKEQLAKLPSSWFLQSGDPEATDRRGIGSALALSGDGEILASLQNPPPGMHTLASAVPHRGNLYLGTITGGPLLRVPAPDPGTAP